MSRASMGFALGLGLALLALAPGCDRDEPVAVAEQPPQHPARESFPAPIELIPDDADGLVGLNPAMFAASAVAQQLAAELATEPRFIEAKHALQSCGIELSSFEAVFMGSHLEQFALVLVGAGFGEDTRATCIIEAAQRSVGAKPDVTITVEDRKKMIDFPDGRVYLVNNNTLVLVTADWKTSVSALIDEEGKPAAKHSKRLLLATVDTTAAAWLAADMPPQLGMLANMVGLPEVGAAENLGGMLKLGEHAVVELSVGFGSPSDAREAATALEAVLAKPAADAPAALTSALSRVDVGHDGGRMWLNFEIAPGDFSALSAAKHAK